SAGTHAPTVAKASTGIVVATPAMVPDRPISSWIRSSTAPKLVMVGRKFSASNTIPTAGRVSWPCRGDWPCREDWLCREDWACRRDGPRGGEWGCRADRICTVDSIRFVYKAYI